VGKYHNVLEGDVKTRMDRVPTEGDCQEFEVEEGYRVVIEPGDYLIVVAGAYYGSAGARFRHPNIAAKQTRLHEFKHYRQGGGKFWTSRAGVDFLFVIPKTEIHLIHEKGYSYVPVEINGQRWSLNVSGGTFDGWTDTVRRVAHVQCGCSQKALRKLAGVALSPGECRRRGITHDIRAMEGYEAARFVERATESLIRGKLGAGHKIVLNSEYHLGDGDRGPFEVEGRGTSWQKRKLSQWIVLTPNQYPTRHRVVPKNIDWEETAKASGLEVAEPYGVNYIGEILEPATAPSGE